MDFVFGEIHLGTCGVGEAVHENQSGKENGYLRSGHPIGLTRFIFLACPDNRRGGHKGHDNERYKKESIFKVEYASL